MTGAKLYGARLSGSPRRPAGGVADVVISNVQSVYAYCERHVEGVLTRRFIQRSARNSRTPVRW